MVVTVQIEYFKQSAFTSIRKLYNIKHSKVLFNFFFVKTLCRLFFLSQRDSSPLMDNRRQREVNFVKISVEFIISMNWRKSSWDVQMLSLNCQLTRQRESAAGLQLPKVFLMPYGTCSSSAFVRKNNSISEISFFFPQHVMEKKCVHHL